MDRKWIDMLRTVAPGLATALGGPLAGLAVSTIANALGVPADKQETMEQGIQTALSGATAEDLLKVKQAENDFTIALEQLGVDLERIAHDDRVSARGREAAVRDWMPGILGVGVTAGFFCVLVLMMIGVFSSAENQTVLIMLGALGAAFGAVVQYYFGSSVGSAHKTDLLARK